MLHLLLLRDISDNLLLSSAVETSLCPHPPSHDNRKQLLVFSFVEIQFLLLLASSYLVVDVGLGEQLIRIHQVVVAVVQLC